MGWGVGLEAAWLLPGWCRAARFGDGGVEGWTEDEKEGGVERVADMLEEGKGGPL